VEKHKRSTTILHYLRAFHKKLGERSSPFEKFSRSSLGEWFTLDAKFQLGVEKSIERGKSFTIIKQHIPILDCRPKVRDELMSLLQKIRTSRQALSRPIVQPIIQSFLELKVLKLLNGSFKVLVE
jgi:hypothetical protein